MPNMRDVANTANVSVSTVSAVLSGKKYVSPKLVTRVKNAIAQTGYVAGDSNEGEFNSDSRSKEVGLILPGIYSSYFQPLLSGIEDMANEAGYNMILCDSKRKWEKERQLLEQLVRRGVQNFILDSVCSIENEEEYYQKVLLPLVREQGKIIYMLSREARYDDLGSVSIDHYKTAYEATAYLIRTGHRQIAHVCGDPTFPHSAQRIQGYRMALLDHGIAYDERLLLEGDFSPISGYAAMNDLLGKGIAVSAVFCANDQMAIGAMKAIQKNGFRIPEDIAVVGFDNLNVSSLVTPGLTTIHYPIYQMGYCAMHNIVDARQGKPVEKKTTLGTKLIIRRSSDPNQVDDWELNKW